MVYGRKTVQLIENAEKTSMVYRISALSPPTPSEIYTRIKWSINIELRNGDSSKYGLMYCTDSCLKKESKDLDYPIIHRICILNYMVLAKR